MKLYLNITDMDETFASSEVFVKNAEKIEEVLEYFKRKINLPIKKFF